jgi:hypothetical protein
MTLRISTSILAGALLALSTLAGPLHAGVIDLDSAPGLLNSASPFTVGITPHPLWQSNSPVNPGDPSDTSAVWISYAPTGYGDGVFQAQSNVPIRIFQPFTSGAGILTLNVWADDTADVLLDGVSLIAPKFTQGICSGQAIGCQPQDVGELSSTLTAGNHTLEFRVYQVGSGTDTTSNPFGLLYTGTATATPEPATLFLAGGVLLTLGIVRRRRAKS